MNSRSQGPNENSCYQDGSARLGKDQADSKPAAGIIYYYSYRAFGGQNKIVYSHAFILKKYCPDLL